MAVDTSVLHKRRRATNPAATVFALAAGTVGGVVLARALTRSFRDEAELEHNESRPTGVARPLPLSPSGGYEFLSHVIWSDSPRMGLGDLEDPEGIESLADAGWELVHVIVPFAHMKFLEAGGYPGNTRKLIAYFRRPKEASHGVN